MLLVLILGVSGFISGLVGFGFGMVGAAVLWILPPREGIPLLMLLSACSQILSISQLRSSMTPLREWWPNGPAPSILGGFFRHSLRPLAALESEFQPTLCNYWSDDHVILSLDDLEICGSVSQPSEAYASEGALCGHDWWSDRWVLCFSGSCYGHLVRSPWIEQGAAASLGSALYFSDATHGPVDFRSPWRSLQRMFGNHLDLLLYRHFDCHKARSDGVREVVKPQLQ